MALLLSLVLGITIAGEDVLQEADSIYRAEVLSILPQDYATVSTGAILNDAASVAYRVYSNYSDEIRNLALDMCAELPPAEEGLIEGMILRDSLDLEAFSQLTAMLGDPAIRIEDYLYLLRAWNPATIALYTKTLFLSRTMGVSELGGRTFAERLVPDLCFHLSGDPDHPVIAVVSLRDVFLVELLLDETGCYMPMSIEWYEEDTEE